MDRMQCFHGYMGLWACRTQWLSEALAAVRSGALRPRAQFDVEGDKEPEQKPYVVEGGVAVLSIMGPTMKGFSKFGGTSTVAMRRALRDAVADDSAQAIMLRIDSPGGKVAGTHELAEDVRAADARKPVHAYAEDTMASAAYWIGSQASRLSANKLAQVGSIGVYGVLYDESKAAEMAGVKVHVVSSGGLKGQGEPGTPITDELLAEAQEQVNAISETFFYAVRKGRGLTEAQLAKVTTGGVWMAEKALEMKLLDSVEPFEKAMAAAAKDGADRARKAAAAARVRGLK